MNRTLLNAPVRPAALGPRATCTWSVLVLLLLLVAAAVRPSAASAHATLEQITRSEIKLLPSGPGHRTTPSQNLAFAGSWTFRLQVQRGTFDAEPAQLTTTIGAP